ncbi:TPA: phage antirepressor N-terminal domain-containing protein [Proteus mirabilis]|uniref:phage antirepressor N-terminal domain-containing protein n=1 Tax=Proteus mirabilis TaxID=584 RepID=UPI0007686C3B|nr:phage antirepressor N-terminal domain-containing protein [Proteus mirabilis]EKU7612896.1 phage antirepressor N-terminal domain-containing protein [Proteus mirabilis]ELA7633297.1 phage antirepressor N-terminal domain-containing protein [Proteus mirabilis]ELA7699816.1 phage antirepressor N-terminal domain-containing protein [Proteus mirabilis]ELA7718303.1 phage antirepressor N-terminal domain-containing protein [Proteus mirabilis]EMA4724050.1 phage antirepressor N-terminal domain-containing p
MNTISTINVPFHGNNLYVVNYKGQPYVPMKPIVEGMGLTWQSQFEKIKQRFKSTITEIVIVAADGKERNMICLALRKLAGWLHTISPNKVKPEIRDKVIKYQEECDDVLYEYWTTGEVKKKHKSTVQERNPLKNAVNLLVSKKGIMYPEAYSLVHQKFNVSSIEELTADQIPDAVEYIHKFVLEGEYIPKQEENILFEPNQNSITVTIPKEGRWLVSYKNEKQQVVSVDGHNVVSVEYIQKLQRDSNALIELLQNFRLRTQVMQGEKSGDILNTPLIA